MKIISLYSTKGGVGKTAAAVNLAYLSSVEGLQTLLWDLDIQSSSTFYFRVKPILKGGSEKILEKENFIKKNIKATNYNNLDIIPSDFSLKDIENILRETKKSKKKFKHLFNDLSDFYDVIIIDCPPGFNILSEYIISLSDIILSPLIPTTLSIRAYDILNENIKNIIDNEFDFYLFFSMVDSRKKMHKSIMTSFPLSNKNCLKSYIPYSSIIEKMGEFRAPVAIMSPGSTPDMCYKSLWQEVNSLIKKSL